MVYQPLSKVLDISSATAQVVAPDLLKAPAILSDTTVRRSAVDQEDLKKYWKSEKRVTFLYIFYDHTMYSIPIPATFLYNHTGNQKKGHISHISLHISSLHISHITSWSYCALQLFPIKELHFISPPCQHLTL